MIKSLILLVIMTLVEIIVFHYYIKYLNRRRYIQSVRELGPKSHYAKNGTPTAGGIVIIIFTILNYLLIKLINQKTYNISDFIIILSLIGFGMIGVLDDLKIIKKHNNDGLKPLTKIIFEGILLLIIYVLLKINGYNNIVTIGNYNIDLKFFSLLFVVFYVMAWSNSFNITDGLDGLASFLSLSLLIGMFIIGKTTKNEILIVSSLSIFFAITGFLIFNFHPALVFMGNVGSHAIGATIGIISIITKNELVITIMGLLFVFETISVILQVLYFKKTKGKRLFKMAPFHHHLEMSGYKETTISLFMLLISFILVIIALVVKGIV